MDGVQTDFTIVTRLALFISFFICIGTIKRYADFEIVAKCTCILMTVFLLLYFTVVDYTIYLAMALPENDINELLEEVPVKPFQVGQYSGLSILSCLLVYNKWSKHNFFNILVSFAVIVTSIILLLISLRRGTILYVFVISLLWLYVNKILSLKNIGILSVLLSVIIVLLVHYGYLFSDLSEGLIARIENDSTGSGRFGDSSSIFALAIRQISDNPLMGTYFRLLTYAERGSYAHNFFLETLMTFGFVFSIPLYILIIKSVYRNMASYINKKDFGYMLYVFLFFFFSLMTSGTIFANFWFWIPLGYLCSEPRHKRSRIKKLAYMANRRS